MKENMGHVTDYRNVILVGDVIEQLKRLPDGIVQCVVTSPPYWGLRDYGTGKWIGGDAQCKHVRKKIVNATDTYHDQIAKGVGDGIYKDVCGLCGAVRKDRQIGLEKTVEEYVQKMVEVFREVRRVLRDDGTLFLNLGDSYAGGGRSGGTDKQNSNKGTIDMPKSIVPNGLKQKDLVGVPWRVAFALQADGWYLRSDIIWWKRNPMPESVTDRPTKAHEQIFLLTKSAKYFYDSFAVRQELSESFKNDSRWRTGSNGNNVKKGYEEHGAQNPKKPHRMYNKEIPAGSNLRSVWDIPAKGYEGAHFATFPPELPERCIRLGTSEAGACECGKGLRRETETETEYHGGSAKAGRSHEEIKQQGKKSRSGDAGNIKSGPVLRTETKGFNMQCKCDNSTIVPCIVMDPFMGSGTTAEVAKRLGRDFIGIELNEKYVQENIIPRMEKVMPLMGAPKIL